jgi:hypothetical protein
VVDSSHTQHEGEEEGVCDETVPLVNAAASRSLLVVVVAGHEKERVA